MSIYSIVSVIYLLWCVYAGGSFEMKIETDSDDAVGIMTEADSNDITEYPHGHVPSAGMFGLWQYILYIQGGPKKTGPLFKVYDFYITT